MVDRLARLSARALDSIDSWLRFRHERSDIPGMAVGISVAGELVFDRSYGYADLSCRKKLSSDHVFRIASHSKTFTATAAMQLNQSGKLNIDKPIVEYLPWLSRHSDCRMRKLSSRQLLNHSAGMVRDGDDGDYWIYHRPFPDRDELRREIENTDLVFDCNRKMKYSNYGFGLLGLVIESVSGQSFSEYVEEQIIGALELNNTGVEYVPHIKEQLVQGYSRAEKPGLRLPLLGSQDTRALAPATGFYSNCRDLCKYFSAHIIGSGLLLDDESKKEMQRTQWRVPNSKLNQEYGLGLQIDYVCDRRVFGHAGGFPGQSTRSMCYPDAGIVVSVLTNAVDSDPTWIVRGIFGFIDFYLRNAGSGDSRQFERFEGRFMTLFSSSDVLAAGQSIALIYSNNWNPFNNDVEELEYVDEQTLRVKSCNGYSCEGELLKYLFSTDGAIESVRCGGVTMLPESRYIAGLAIKDDEAASP